MEKQDLLGVWTQQLLNIWSDIDLNIILGHAILTASPWLCRDNATEHDEGDALVSFLQGPSR
jgi:hypothetical protein